MEHLSWSYDLDKPRPKTPYLCDGFEHFIFGELSDLYSWPQSQGLTTSRNSSPLDLARLCQGWLFFGFLRILARAAGYEFRLEDFIDNSGNYVDSANISVLLRQLTLPKRFWKRSSGDWLATRVVLEMARRILSKKSVWVHSIVALIEQYSRECDPWTCELINVPWSTMMLLEYVVEIIESSDPSSYLQKARGGEVSGLGLRIISRSRTDVRKLATLLDLDEAIRRGQDFDDSPRQTRSKNAHDVMFPTHSQSMAQGLRILGHCPTILKRVFFTSLDIYRIMAMPQPTNVDHQSCTGRDCKAFNICEAEYVMQHAVGCMDQEYCSRSIVRIDNALLLDLIKRECDVTVRSQIDRDGKLDVTITDGTNISGMTAISHVWAGGLGNFAENAHFPCQLRYIHQKIASGMSHRRQISTIYYWFDTLCIPAQRGPLKTAAINRMASSYAKCKSVLVLDPVLTKLNSDDMSAGAVKAAILSSSWMARSWTLQEAALAVQLDFVFADAVIDFSSIDTKHNLSTSTMLQSLWKNDVATFDPQSASELLLRSSRIDFNDQETGPIAETSGNESLLGFTSMWNSLCNRNSTKTEDLPSILAILLGCSAGEILSLEDEDERLHALLKSQTELPISILFVPLIRSEDWHPIFPTSSGPISFLSDEMGMMKINGSNQFEIEHYSLGILLECEQPLSMSGKVIVHDRTNLQIWELDFGVLPSGASSTEHNMLLFLSASSNKTGRKDQGPGLCFAKTADDNSSLGARFLRSCTWRFLGTSSDHSEATDSGPSVPRTLSNRTDVTYDTTRARQRHCSRACPLTLDMGLSSFRLSWSRPNFYPFRVTTNGLARQLNLFLYIPVFTYPYLGLYFFFAVATGKRDHRYFRLLAFFSAVIIITARKAAAQYEYSWLRGMVHQSLQRIWASSFNSVDATKRQVSLFGRAQYRKLSLFICLQGVSLILSTIWSVILLLEGDGNKNLCFEADFGECVMALSTTALFYNRQDPVWLVILRPVIISLSSELTIRAIFTVWIRPWQVQNQINKLASQRSTLNIRSSADSQYDLALFAKTIILSTVFSGFLVVELSIAAMGFKAHFSPGAELKWYNWLGLILSTLAFAFVSAVLLLLGPVRIFVMVYVPTKAHKVFWMFGY